MQFIFDQPHAKALNEARLNHLASLGLKLENSTVLEVGAGIGLLTGFFEKLGCRVLSTDAREINVEEHRRRYPHRRVELADLSKSGSHDRFGEFDIVFCYGILYHLSNPALAIKDLSKACRDLLLLETCVYPIDNGRINHLKEPEGQLDQSVEGTGCRPARNWVLSELRKHFPYAYVTASQPDHPDFPLSWPVLQKNRLTRSVFVASKKPLDIPILLQDLPDNQYVSASLQSSIKFETHLPLKKTENKKTVMNPKTSISDTVTNGREDFLEWITKLATAQKRLYYRDQTPESLNELIDLVNKYKPTKIVELGTLSGLSLRTWLSVDTDAEITAVDLSFAPLRQSREIIPVDLSRVKLLERNILHVDFSLLWGPKDRVLLYVDAHDTPNAPIMEYVLRNAVSKLPSGSIVVVDDLWYSPSTLGSKTARQFFEDTVINEIDPLQCFQGYYAPYWKGGSFFGFREVIPLMEWVNRNRIELIFKSGVKSVTFEWPQKNSVEAKFYTEAFEQLTGKVSYNPVEKLSLSRDESLPANQQALDLCEKGSQLYASGNMNEAMNCFQQASNITPHLSGVFYAQAVCLARVGQLEAATKILQEELKSHLPHPNAHALLDDIRSWTNKQQNSKQELPQKEQTQAITIFTMPKPFKGHINVIQRNAIKSWTLLRPRPEIILLGDEEGTAEVAAEFNVKHISYVERNEFGTPLVNSIFQLAEANSVTEWLAYVNADIILLDDFSNAMMFLKRGLEDLNIYRFLLSSQRIELDIREPIPFSQTDWQSKLRAVLCANGVLDFKAAVEMVLFSRGLFTDIPPFAIGRTVWDNWLVWKAKDRGAAIVDGSEVFKLIHQAHDYCHVAGGFREAWKGLESQRNRILAQGGHRLGINSASTHILTKEGLRRGVSPENAQNDLLVKCRIRRGCDEFRNGNYASALDFMDNALYRSGGRTPMPRSFHHIRAVCLINLHRFKEAEEALMEECRTYPDNREAKELLAQVQNRGSNQMDLSPSKPVQGDLSTIRPKQPKQSELDNIIPPEIKDDEFYYAIQKLAREENIKTVLEIGSSAGTGSTEAFVTGLRENPNKTTLFCIEISKPRFAELQKRYSEDSFVKCYNVSSVSLEKFPSKQEVIQFYKTTKTALNNYPLDRILGWFHQDIEYTKNSGVPDDGIQRIKQQNNISNFDMVLIDGSAFTGSAELDEVYGAKFILLDDINDIKNYNNYKRLSADPNYLLVTKNWKLRNGFAIFKRNDPGLPIHFFTIVLNGQPFIRHHIEVFKQLPFKWHWHIVEGVADLKYDTAWSLQFGGRITDEFHRNGLSNDGTTEYLDNLVRQFPENVTIYRKSDSSFWDGKLEMVNAPLANITEECLLWQVDADELWTTEQICAARFMFDRHPDKTAAYYFCNYFVGENLVTVTRDTYGNYTSYEWLRTWRFKPDFRWMSHEPPRLCQQMKDGRWIDLAMINPFKHSETEARNLIFQHYAYVTEQQLRFKESYFGYANAVKQWKSLQECTRFPVRLRDYLAWVKDGAQVDTVQSQDIRPIARKNSFGQWCFRQYEVPKVHDHRYREKGRNPNVDNSSMVSIAEHNIKNILVVSHERSGTHFLINTIAFNFPYYSNNEISVTGGSQELKRTFANNYFRKERRIFKSHHQFYFFESFFEELIQHFHVFYIVRDGRDVLNSCFHYYNKYPDIFPFAKSKSISEFLATDPDRSYSLRHAANVIERWTMHVESWLAVRDKITIVRYEDLKINFEDMVARIASILGYNIPTQLIVPTLSDKSVSPRKGIVGDWRKHFTDSDLVTFNAIASGCMKKLGYYDKDLYDTSIVQKNNRTQDSFHILGLQGNEPRNILWIRTDSIGDNILAASMLPYIREKYKHARITVVCQDHIRKLYEACPFVDNIVSFNKVRAYQDDQYRSNILRCLQALNADLALNSVYSREPLTDLFAIDGGARERFAFNGNLCNISPEIRDKYNQFYTQLLPSNEEHKLELERHRDFLKGFGINVWSLQPIIWTTPEDESFADDLFTKNNLTPDKTIVLFAGAQCKIRLYGQYGSALAQFCKDRQFSIIAIGAEHEYDLNQQNLQDAGVRSLNLCGKITIRQSTAVLKRCRMAVGAETGLAHIACAANTPNVILLGGGHFGRFMPYSSLTSIVCLPLECYGCNWNCKYQAPYCIRSIAPEVIAEAIRQALNPSSKKPRVYIQGNSLWNQKIGQPKWKWFHRFLDMDSVEIIPVGDVTEHIDEAKMVDMINDLCKKNKCEEALLKISGALEQFPNSPDLLNLQAELMFKMGNLEKAKSTLVKLNERWPTYNMAYNNLGVIFWQTGEVNKSLQYLTKALQIDPYDRSTILNCGMVLTKLGKTEDAKKLYSSYIQRSPDDAEIFHLLEGLKGKIYKC